MAILDEERNAVVLRIVYDGPAAAGKTTSVRSLATSLSRPTSSPEQAGERTLYFDWLEYTGGLFEGYQLRCQVVSVPGQAVLARRRNLLIGGADAVIYVSEIARGSEGSVISALSSLQASLSLSSREPVGIVLQANKRDLPDALPADALRAALDDSGLRIGVVESTATTGAGIREAFVFGVRLALDRVREQLRTGALRRGRPEIDSAEDLYRQMCSSEIAGGKSALSDAPSTHRTLGDVLAGLVADERAEDERRAPESDSEVPLAPDESVPTGMIWPPIEGRLVLREAGAEGADVSRLDDGWAASTPSWRFYSPASAAFADVEQGRAALVDWARLHAQHSHVLSSPRCIALANDGRGGWRLWQVVRARPSLRDRLVSMLDEQSVDRVAASLVDASSRLVELDERVGPSPLPVTIDTAGVSASETCYVGLVPQWGAPRPRRPDHIEREMRTIVNDWSPRRSELAGALARARSRAVSPPERAVIDRLARMFGES